MSGREKENLIAHWLEEDEEEVVRTADYIFRHPETAYKEELSSTYLASFLQENGFRVEKKTAGIDTAFTADWGEEWDPGDTARLRVPGRGNHVREDRHEPGGSL